MLYEQSCVPVEPNLLSRKPDIAGPLGHDSGGTILILDFPEAVEVVSQSFKLPEKTLHPRPHFVSTIVLGVVLIVENDIFGIKPQAGSVVEAIGINRINIFFEELLNRSLWTGRIPGRSRNAAYQLRHNWRTDSTKGVAEYTDLLFDRD